MSPKMIVGIDECGLGAIAGPLVVCAFTAPDEAWTHKGLDDSKKLSKKRREELREELINMRDVGYIFQCVSSAEIDKIGVEVCLRRAMNTALEQLIRLMKVLPERVIIDGEDKGVPGAEFFPKADGTYPVVMAASIIGKVYHDEYMAEIAKEYPLWGFEKHMGYPTAEHKKAIAEHGLCPHHRRSYSPIAAVVSGEK